jgi:nucleoside-diphosphate-sugar epimerase
VKQGHEVEGIRKSRRNDAALKAAGIVPLLADITDAQSLSGSDPGYDWVVHCVSASGGGVAEYEDLYVKGTGHLVEWLSQVPPSKFVFTGSTSVYGQTDGSRVDETSQATPEAATGRVLIRAENLLLKAAETSGFPAVLLRVAGIYGPGRAYWLEQIRLGSGMVRGGVNRFLNMIHRDDVVGAVMAALTRGVPGRIYNVVDDEPVTQGDLFQWLLRRLGQLMPPNVSNTQVESAFRKRGTTNKRVSNQRLKDELGCQLKFPTFRQGYEMLLRFG